ncbi:helix-turn-helix domain-containing protein [Kineococcus sp. SYSU DK001]|uniref:helix-turn-helix domain-containing protein n=1 Tax=Kineococcus sp. SYSU DK001 TaxID=3383122 RepID=UPI003D7D69BB
MPVIESVEVLLKDARRRAGLTQTQVGQRAGVTQSVISDYESGHRQPSLPTLLHLLRASGHLLDASLIAIDSPPAAPLTGPLGQRRRRREVEAIAAAHGVHHGRVFGSTARGTERPGSDVNLFVELPAGTGLFALGRLRRELEGLLGAPVDMVPRGRAESRGARARGSPPGAPVRTSSEAQQFPGPARVAGTGWYGVQRRNGCVAAPRHARTPVSVQVR